jgi:hypothetical protein
MPRAGQDGMDRFYFHVSRDGVRTQDQVGLPFEDRQAACADALEKMPDLLRRASKQHHTYVTTEVWDATRPLYVLRGSIHVEEFNGKIAV